MYGCTAAFRCIGPITEAEASKTLSNLSTRVKKKLMLQAQNRLPPEVSEAMQCAYANMLVDEGLLLEAEGIISAITALPLSDDPVYTMSGIVNTNRKCVAEKLALAQRSARRWILASPAHGPGTARKHFVIQAAELGHHPGISPGTKPRYSTATVSHVGWPDFRDSLKLLCCAFRRGFGWCSLS